MSLRDISCRDVQEINEVWKNTKEKLVVDYKRKSKEVTMMLKITGCLCLFRVIHFAICVVRRGNERGVVLQVSLIRHQDLSLIIQETHVKRSIRRLEIRRLERKKPNDNPLNL
jgi:hypothetical protein